MEMASYGQKCMEMETYAQRLIDISARAFCDLLAINRAHMLNFAHGEYCLFVLFICIASFGGFPFGSAGLALLLVGLLGGLLGGVARCGLL
jgi:hypothetical protein